MRGKTGLTIGMRDRVTIFKKKKAYFKRNIFKYGYLQQKKFMKKEMKQCL